MACIPMRECASSPKVSRAWGFCLNVPHHTSQKRAVSQGSQLRYILFTFVVQETFNKQVVNLDRSSLNCKSNRQTDEIDSQMSNVRKRLHESHRDLGNACGICTQRCWLIRSETSVQTDRFNLHLGRLRDRLPANDARVLSPSRRHQRGTLVPLE